MTADFTRLPKTCSMIEMGNPRFLDKYLTQKNFLYNLDEWLRLNNYSNRQNKRYSILYNCVDSEKRKHLERIGFKAIGSYKGDSQVTILLLDVNKETKMSFWEWWNS